MLRQIYLIGCIWCSTQSATIHNQILLTTFSFRPSSLLKFSFNFSSHLYVQLWFAPTFLCIHSNAVVIAERIGWQHFHLKKEFVKKLQICFTIYFEEVSGETPRCITIHHHYLCIIFSIDIDNGDDNLEGFRDCGQSSS